MPYQETEINQETFDAILATARRVEDKKKYIKASIIRRMDNRRGRRGSMSQGEVLENLLSLDPNKPGEEYEFLAAMVRADESITPEMALELGDMMYNYCQENAPALPYYSFVIEGLLGIPMNWAFAFCIVKYETRLLFGDRPDYREIEEEVMTQFLETLPNTKLWPRSEY